MTVRKVVVSALLFVLAAIWDISVFVGKIAIFIYAFNRWVVL